MEEVALYFEKAAINYKNLLPVTGTRDNWRPGTEEKDMTMNRSGDSEAVRRYVAGAVVQAPRWGEGVWNRVVCSTLIAGGVQWICVGSAILASYETPTVGLGYVCICFQMKFNAYSPL